MYPLIEIRSIPIEITMKVNNAKLEYRRGTAEMEISRTKVGLNIKRRPIKLKLDTFEARSSLSPTTIQSVTQSAEAGKNAAYAATATYARKGQLLLEAKVGQELVTQFAQESMEEKTETNVGLEFLPQGGADIQWDQGEMQIRYEMDKLNFDWKIDTADFEFTPGNIEISVSQQPDVIIKYVGGAIYVPPSSDPNYKPIDVEV